jgi:hypothetical protein
VELEQSDGDFAAQPSVAPEGSAVELDAISSESTHYNLPKTPERPSSPSLYERPSASSLALPVVGARSRLSYVLAGLGAAVISAVVTWQLMTRQAGLPSQPQAEPAGDGGPVLLMYEVPDSEPPPAPLLTTDPPIPAASGAPAAAASGPRNPAGQPDETGELELNSTPPGAAVYLNKELVGTTPLRVPGLPLSSDVKIELKLDGFAKTRKRIKWKGEKQLSVTVKLKPGDAASPDGADPPAAKAPGEGPPTTSSPP